jgi:hypothetical protein
MSRLDRKTVSVVELTAPGAFETDAVKLHQLLKEGTIFGAFSESERVSIWTKLLAVSADRLIPSLHSFFEDVRYLRGPAKCVKRLMPPSCRTLKSSVSSVEPHRDVCMVQVSEMELEVRSGNIEVLCDIRYRTAWLSAMRNWVDIPLEQKRSKKDLLAQPAVTENEFVLLLFAMLLYKVGFVTPQIEELIERSKAQSLQSIPGLAGAGLHDEEEWRMDARYVPDRQHRCGIPRACEYESDRKWLFLDKMHGKYIARASVTSFFVRRSVYLAFFGPIARMPDANTPAQRMQIFAAQPTGHVEQVLEDMEGVLSQEAGPEQPLEQQRLDKLAQEIGARERQSQIEREGLDEERQNQANRLRNLQDRE